MLRFLYTVAMYVATPIIVWRLMARGFRYRGYFRRWRERFGRFPDPGLRNCIWIHAVSVGEVNAAVPLIQSLRRRYAPRPMVVTTVTPTGSERVRKLFGDEVFHVYLPYDLPRAVTRFLDRIRPVLAVVVETEIWPNLFHHCGRRGIPLAVVNARLSERSLRGYRPIRALVRQALGNVALVAAQSHADARRYRALGAPASRVHVSGNLKYDIPLPKGARQRGEELRAGWGETRPVWIAASTHEGEDLAAFEAHLAVLARMPDALLLVAARHPERFRLVEHAARNLGFTVATHNAGDADAETQCLVIDAMGVMMRYFAASDLAFVAGSLVPIGGHNVLEPAALSKPVVVGPYTFNFEEITRTLVAAGGACRIESSQELGATVLDLLRDPEALARMGAAARAVCARERGAARRTMVLLGRIFARARYRDENRKAPLTATRR
ncbi:MAG TPA: lipid IV(A) 3-deoxy-D-manno-octulosonic acid transferase [Rhodanobacteraceae bacterium]|jgi:3-deoxy-D-manno-octulosonic-acid transferase|nr:lipid IV(A) 3-deoxy-D-manno-octulosonic acid transferase [Rhodanobacteraceae bacterium]